MRAAQSETNRVGQRVRVGTKRSKAGQSTVDVDIGTDQDRSDLKRNVDEVHLALSHRNGRIDRDGRRPIVESQGQKLGVGRSFLGQLHQVPVQNVLTLEQSPSRTRWDRIVVAIRIGPEVEPCGVPSIGHKVGTVQELIVRHQDAIRHTERIESSSSRSRH